MTLSMVCEANVCMNSERFRKEKIVPKSDLKVEIVNQSREPSSPFRTRNKTYINPVKLADFKRV